MRPQGTISVLGKQQKQSVLFRALSVLLATLLVIGLVPAVAMAGEAGAAGATGALNEQTAADAAPDAPDAGDVSLGAAQTAPSNAGDAALDAPDAGDAALGAPDAGDAALGAAEANPLVALAEDAEDAGATNAGANSAFTALSITPLAATNIDIASITGSSTAPTTGNGWSFDGTKLTIKAGADVAISGTVSNGRYIEIEGSATVTLSSLSITNPNGAAIRVKDGSVTFTLVGQSALVGQQKDSDGAGIWADNGTVTIQGSGVLTARGARYSPGIGGKQSANLYIASGAVNAYGGQDAPGLGGSGGGLIGSINISGGTVYAEGGINGAGIGSGGVCFSSTVNISGGDVTAKGNGSADAIGGANSTSGSGRTVTISGGTVTTLGGTATGNIGSSPAGCKSPVVITGGNIVCSGTINAPTNGSNQVYLNTLTVGKPTVQANAALSALTYNATSYGVQGVSTDSSGKVYVYLPASSNERVAATIGNTSYEKTYARNANNNNAQTLALSLAYTATANGAQNIDTTTCLTLEFNTAVTGLTADKINLSNGTGSATKGALTGQGTSYYLALTNVQQGTISVTVDDFGTFTIPQSTLSNIEVYQDVRQPEATPAAKVEYLDEQLGNLAANANYTIDGINYQASANGTIDISSAWSTPGATLAIIKKGNGTSTKDSAAQNLTINARPAAPVIAPTGETIAGLNDGKLSGLTTAMEYRLLPAGLWITATGQTVSHLAPGTYEVRVKVGLANFVGAATQVSINAGAAQTRILTVIAPSFGEEIYGYSQPPAQALTIKNTGNSTANIASVAMEQGSSSAFTISGGGATVGPDGASITSWTVQPNESLGASASPYSDNIIVTFDNNGTARAEVSFTVAPAAQAAPAAPSVNMHTATSITLLKSDDSQNTGLSCEYAIATTATPASLSWQSTLSFGGRAPNTAYYLFARYAGNANYTASPASAPVSATTNKATLTGTITISGTLCYGEKLTAHPSLNSEPDLTATTGRGDASYTWRRGGEIIDGASGLEYTLGVDDIGKTITVEVSTALCTGAVKSLGTTAIAKAQGPAAPTVTTIKSSSLDNKTFVVTIDAIAGAEYSANGGQNWHSSNVFEGYVLGESAVTFSARIKETATHFAGATGNSAPESFDNRLDPPPAPKQGEITVKTENDPTTGRFPKKISVAPEGDEYEYSFNGGSWQDENWIEVESDEPIDVVVRLKATDTTKESDGTHYNDTRSRVATPNASINYAQEVLTGLDASSEYRINGTVYNTNSAGELAIGAGLLGSTITLIKMGDGVATVDSLAQPVGIKARPLAPSGIQATDESVDGQNDGKISGVNTTMQYKLHSDTTWTSIGGTELIDLAPANYDVRFAATATDFASEILSVTIDAGESQTRNPALVVPTFADVVYGYVQPAAKNISVTNIGNSPVTIAMVEIKGTGKDAFDFVTTEKTVGAYSNINSWTVQPKPGLGVGTHTAAIEVTCPDGTGSKTIIKQVSIRVTPAPQAAPAAPEESSHSAVAILLKKLADSPVSGLACEYGISLTNSADTVLSWQPELSFVYRAPNTTYYLFARYKAGANYTASPASPSTTVKTEMAHLTGKITISGTLRYGEKLTAHPDLGSNPDLTPTGGRGTSFYTWRRGGEIIDGVSGLEYTLGVDDIGKTITVEVSTALCTGAVKSLDTTAIAKAQGPAAPAVTAAKSSSLDNKTFVVTIDAIADAEYSVDGGQNWQSSTVFEGFKLGDAAVTLSARIAETATHLAGTTGTSAAVRFDERLDPPPAPGADEVDIVIANDPTTGSFPKTIRVLPEGPEYEYKFNGGAWQDSNIIVVNSDEPINVAVRLKETDTTKPSDETRYNDTRSRENTPGPSINYQQERLASLAAESYYRVEGKIYRTNSAGTLAIEDAWIGTSITVVKMGDGINTVDSLPQPVVVNARPQAPFGIQTTEESVDGQNDGKLSRVSSDMEYKEHSSASWIAIDGTEVLNLAPASYDVRIAATTTSFASVAVDAVVGKGAQQTRALSLDVPSFDNVIYGYGRPAAKPITVNNTGNSQVVISTVEITGVGKDAFDFVIANKTVDALASLTSWTVQPKPGLDAGIYLATITVTFPNGGVDATVAKQVSLYVEQAGQSAPGAPTHALHTATVVELNAVANSLLGVAGEYACALSSAAPAFGWQPGLSFAGLDPNTTYYFFARYPGDANYTASPASAPLSVKTTMASLGGSVSLSGTLRCGEELTVNTWGLSSNPDISGTTGLGMLSYSWKRNGSTIVGAESNTYTLGALDIGNTISVEVTAALCLGFKSDTTGVIDKAPSPVAPGDDEVKVIITPDPTTGSFPKTIKVMPEGPEYEYSFNGGAWQDDNTLVVNTDEPIDVVVRLKETPTTEASEGTRYIDNRSRVATPTAGIDYAGELIKGLIPNSSYRIDGSIYSTDGAGALAIDASWIGTTVAVVAMGDGTSTVDSLPQSVVIKARPLAPAGIQSTEESVDGLCDGKIANVDTTMEYKEHSSTSWLTIGAAEITDLAPGTYDIRFAATSTDFASPALEVIVGVGAAQMAVYPVLEHFGTYTGSGSVAARVDADHTKFVRLLYLGEEIAPANYSITHGSTIITLTESYVAGFANGTHWFIAEFSDGRSENIRLDVNVPAVDAPAAPEVSEGKPLPFTGESGVVLGLCAAALLAALAGIICLILWRRRREERQN